MDKEYVRMGKILIVIPQYYDVSKGGRYYEMPLGLAYINAALRNANMDVICLNMNHLGTDGYQILEKMIIEENIAYILCGAITPFHSVLRKVFETARQANPNIITIGGGGAFTSEPILFSEYMNVDYAVIGEGDVTDVELLRALMDGGNPQEVDGIVYKTDHGYLQTPERKPVENLDELPFPCYEDFDVEAYLDCQMVSHTYYHVYTDKPRFMPMTMARSCPYRCKFCFHPVGNKYRSRSLDNFFEELDWLIDKYKINGIIILDELFSASIQRVYDFCERIKGYNIKWLVQMRVDIMTEELLQLMKAAGCVSISYGIESFSETVLKNMNKHIQPQEIEKALLLTYQAGIDIQGNFIFGDEMETTETLFHTLKWWGKHQEYGLNLGLIETYPGTGYYNNYFSGKTKEDRLAFIKSGNYILNLTSMPEQEFEKVKLALRMLFLYENEKNVGTVEQKYENEKGEIVFRTKCVRCGAHNEYVGMDPMIFKKLLFKMSCRECGRRNVYYTRPFDKINGYYTMEYLCRMILEAKDVHDFKEALNVLYDTYLLWKSESRVFPV